MKPYYSDESVRLYHGDCREVTAWLDADVLVTDPPYGVSLALEFGFTRCAVCGRSSRSRAGTCADCRAGETGQSLVTRVAGDESTEARDAALSRWGDRPALVFGTWRSERPSQTRQVLIWDKSHNGPGMGALDLPWGPSHEDIYVIGSGFKGKRETSVLTVTPYNSQSANRPGHPTPKPLILMERLIEKCPPGTVADPFAGSGSTLVAAKQLGRKAIGVELEERYCEVIAKRLSQGVLDFGESA